MIEDFLSIQIVRREQPIHHSYESVLLKLLDHVDWWYEIYNAFLWQKLDMPLKDLSNYVIISRELYYCLLSDVMTRCVNDKETYCRLREIHDCTYGRVSLYHRMQREVYYWPNMAQQAIEFQPQCVTYQQTYYQSKECFVANGV